VKNSVEGCKKKEDFELREDEGVAAGDRGVQKL